MKPRVQFFLKKAFLVVYVILLGSGCTLFKKDPEPESKLSKEDQKKLAEYEAEVTLGRDMAGRLLQYYGTYGNEGVVSYINHVGSYVASLGDFPERRYMFAVLDTKAINAFACPGGYILVTLGALELADSEAELAMILGHEVAHVGLQHMYNTLKSMGEREIEKAAKDTDKKEGFKKAYESEVRRRPEADASESAALLTRYLAGSAGVGMTLLQAAKAGMNVLLEKGLDEKLEFEADHEGVSWAIRAGYEPTAMLKFLNRLAKQKKAARKDKKTEALDKTHPKISTRKKRIRDLLAKMDAKNIVGAKGEDRFQQNLQPVKQGSGTGKK